MAVHNFPKCRASSGYRGVTYLAKKSWYGLMILQASAFHRPLSTALLTSCTKISVIMDLLKKSIFGMLMSFMSFRDKERSVLFCGMISRGIRDVPVCSCCGLLDQLLEGCLHSQWSRFSGSLYNPRRLKNSQAESLQSCGLWAAL